MVKKLSFHSLTTVASILFMRSDDIPSWLVLHDNTKIKGKLLKSGRGIASMIRKRNDSL